MPQQLVTVCGPWISNEDNPGDPLPNGNIPQLLEDYPYPAILKIEDPTGTMPIQVPNLYCWDIVVSDESVTADLITNPDYIVLQFEDIIDATPA